MDYTQSGSDILLKQPDFGLDDTLDCGQAFRWEKIDKKTYSGAFLNNKLTISEDPTWQKEVDSLAVCREIWRIL